MDIAPARAVALTRRELDVLFVARHVTLVAFMVSTYVGRRHLPWWEPASDLGILVPLSLLCHRVSRRRLCVPSWLPVTDAVACATWLVLQPAMAAPLMSLLVATLTLGGLAADLRALWVAFGIGVAGSFTSALLVGETSALVSAARSTAIGAAVFTALTVVRFAFAHSQALIAHRAARDLLTDLANRETMATATAEALVAGPCAFLLLDLDNFKEINDSLGHHVGDEVLVEVARRLQAVAGEQSTAGRLGGDEFAVLVPGADRRAAVEIAERVAAALDQPMSIDGLRLEARASVGIALSPDHGDEVQLLQQHADVAMYDAKRNGRPYRVYDPDTDRSSVRRLTLMGELRDAIASNQLELWYQPIMGLHRRMIVGMEALVRWRHPDHGLLMPGEFIELAEISGAIDELTRWVVERAVLDAHRLQRGGYRLSISCNLAVRNLHDEDLIAFVADAFDRLGPPPAGLWLELTETQLVEDPTGAAHVLGRLHEMGVLTAVDDFGTGYSSLSLLHRVRTSGLKIDRSFVAALTRDPDAGVLVDSMIELGHRLGMIVIAEGIEDESTLEELIRRGCDGAQGYHVARPLPFDDLVGHLGTVAVERAPAPSDR